MNKPKIKSIFFTLLLSMSLVVMLGCSLETNVPPEVKEAADETIPDHGSRLNYLYNGYFKIDNFSEAEKYNVPHALYVLTNMRDIGEDKIVAQFTQVHEDGYYLYETLYDGSNISSMIWKYLGYSSRANKYFDIFFNHVSFKIPYGGYYEKTYAKLRYFAPLGGGIWGYRVFTYNFKFAW